MPAPAVIESFCERCGTRYTFEPPRQRGRSLTSLGKTLGILSENGTPESASLTASRDPFHGMFHFCLECRQYTCPDCWNTEAGFCQGCYPLPESPDMMAAESAASTEATTHLLVALEQVRVASAPDAWPGTDLPHPEPEPEPLAALDTAVASDAVVLDSGDVATSIDPEMVAPDAPEVATSVVLASPVEAEAAADGASAAPPDAAGTSFEWIDPEPVAELTPADIARVGDAPTFTAMVAAAVAASLQAPPPPPEPEPSIVAEAAVEAAPTTEGTEAAVEVMAAAEPQAPETAFAAVAGEGAAEASPGADAVEPVAGADSDDVPAEATAISDDPLSETIETATDAVAASAAEPVAPEAVEVVAVTEASADEAVASEAESVVAEAPMPIEPEAVPAPRRHDPASDPEADAWLAMDAMAVVATRHGGDIAAAPLAAPTEIAAPEVEAAVVASLEAVAPVTPLEAVEVVAEPSIEVSDPTTAEPVPAVAAESAVAEQTVAEQIATEPAVAEPSVAEQVTTEPTVEPAQLAAEPVLDVAAIAQTDAADQVTVQEAAVTAATHTNGHDHAAPVAGLAALGLAHKATDHEHDQPDLDETWAVLLAATPITEPEAQPDDMAADDWQALAPSLGPDVAQPLVAPAPATPAPAAPAVPQPDLAPTLPATPPVAWPAAAAPAAWQHTAPEVPGQAPAWRPYGSVYAAPNGMGASANGAPHPAVLSGMAPGAAGFGAAAASNGHLPTGVRPCHNCALPVSAQARFCRRCGQSQV